MLVCINCLSSSRSTIEITNKEGKLIRVQDHKCSECGCLSSVNVANKCEALKEIKLKYGYTK